MAQIATLPPPPPKLPRHFSSPSLSHLDKWVLVLRARMDGQSNTFEPPKERSALLQPKTILGFCSHPLVFHCL